MPDFKFSDFAQTTLSAATNKDDGSPISAQKLDRVVDYLQSPGSGPDAISSYADYLDEKLRSYPPELAPGVDYVAFSGKDGSAVPNLRNAVGYTDDVGRTAGIIGDTRLGKFTGS